MIFLSTLHLHHLFNVFLFLQFWFATSTRDKETPWFWEELRTLLLILVKKITAMIYSVPDSESALKMWILHKHFSCSYQYLFRLAEFREVFQGFYHQGLIWLWSIFALKFLMVHKGNRVSSNYGVLNSEKYHSERCHRNFQHEVELCNKIISLHKIRKFGRHIFNMYGQSRLQTLITKCGWDVRILFLFNVHLWKSPLVLQWFKGQISTCPLFVLPVSLAFLYLDVSFR